MHGRAEQAMQTYSFPWAQHRLSPDAAFLARHFPARYFSRPTLVAPAAVAATQENLNTVLDVLFDAPHRLTGGDLAAFGRALGYDEVRLAFACAAELGPLSRIGRADLHRTADGFKLLELNLSSALGGLPMSLLAKVMTRDPELAALLAEHGYAPVDTFAAVRHLLGAACPGDREITVALVSTPSTYAGHREVLSATAQLLGGPGVTVVAADPVDLVIGADGVAWQGRGIDVVYRMFTLSQLVATETDRRWGMELIRATRSGRTPMVSPLSTSFLGSKNVLALLWSRRMRELMSPRERAAVSALVPISFQLKVDSVDGRIRCSSTTTVAITASSSTARSWNTNTNSNPPSTSGT